MIYLIVALSLIVIILSIVLILIKRKKIPFFSNVDDLTSFLRETDCNGQGISLSRFKKILSRQYRKSVIKANNGNKLFNYENWLTDNHYKLLASLREIQKFDFRSLPHAGNSPRIVTIARYAVSSGYDKNVESLIAFLKEVQNKIDLDYNELSAYRYAIVFAELEKAVDCASFSLSSAAIEKRARNDEEIKNRNYE